MCFQQSFENARDRQQYDEIIEQVGWFLFDLFVLGYVEDPIMGKSFQFPVGMSWRVYVEVSDGQFPEYSCAFMRELVVNGKHTYYIKYSIKGVKIIVV